MAKLSFLFLSVILTIPVFGQEKCATVEYEDLRKRMNPQLESSEQFESWMAEQLLLKSQNKASRSGISSNHLIIPVVVHVVHNGEAIGTGSNIPDSRIFEQIQVLNDDFRRQNTDTVNTPEMFKPVAADTEIEFRLAQRDPEGLPTNGIQRVTGTNEEWDIYQSTELKSLSYWPAEDYMNIWVTPFANRFLGFAQFPVSNLPGLSQSSENRLTDGVVIETTYFGNNNTIAPESLGRTTTHEVGHFLGLRHIWGDGPCNVDDFCADTPLSDGSNFGCPVDKISCGSIDMVQNYMDLTNDACMNIFTQSQKDRMHVVLTNSPRRASLVVSKGATPPVVFSNDAGIMAIKKPQVTTCNADLVPEVSIRNYGSNQLSTTAIQLRIDGVLFDTQTPNLNLDPLAIAQVSFASFNISPGSNHNFEFRITQANGVADENADNDVRSETVSLSQTSPLPISADFTSFPSQWTVSNPDNLTTWAIKTAPNQNVSNQAIHMNFFSYEDAIGDYDFLLSPLIDLTQYSSSQVAFEVAYATFSGGSNDGLIVAISTDCGNTFSRADYLFEKYGADLATAPTTGSSFTPSDRTQWKAEILNLNDFLSSSEVQIAFIGVNDYGNNLYLDNIQITGVPKTGLDLAVTRVVQPGIVSCENSFSPVVRVKNEGVNTISSFQVSYQLGLETPVTVDYSGPAIQPGEETDITFQEVTIGNGTSNIVASIANPNGETQDDNIENDTSNVSFLIDQETELVPVREDFANFSQIDWSIINTDAAMTWEAANLTNGNVAVFINNFNYEEKGQLDFLVSPVLDFSESDSARLTFRVSYASGNNFNDGLLVLATKDCGGEFTDTLFQKFGPDLAVNQSSSAWVPTQEADWVTEIINLNEYAGLDNVRIAFVAINDFGNNLYIDDIQFFNSNSTAALALDPENMVIFPNPAGDTFQVSFNLAQREEIVLSMVDATGRILFQRPLTNTLNQTYEFDLPHLAQGMYILQAKGPTFQQSKRLIISK